MFFIGKTVLHWAAAVNNATAAAVLLKHGANRDAPDHKVTTSPHSQCLTVYIVHPLLFVPYKNKNQIKIQVRDDWVNQQFPDLSHYIAKTR